MSWSFFFFCSAPATTDIYTLSLTTLFRSLRAFLHLRGHPVSSLVVVVYPGQQPPCRMGSVARGARDSRSEEHTSELQSRQYLVCRLLLEKKKNVDAHTGLHTSTQYRRVSG